MPNSPSAIATDRAGAVIRGNGKTSEPTYNRLPAFHVRKQFFNRIHELDDVLLVSCASVQERNELLAAEPGKCFITPHYEDYPAVLVRPRKVDRDELTELITESWRWPAGIGCHRCANSPGIWVWRSARWPARTREFEAEGLIRSRRGGGTRVVDSPLVRSDAERERLIGEHAAGFVRQVRLLAASDTEVLDAVRRALTVRGADHVAPP